MQCLNFIQQMDSNGQILKSLTLINILTIVLKVGLEYPQELCNLHNDYPLALDKIEIKKEMMPEFQLKITDLYNIPIGNIKKLLPNFFDKDKCVLQYENLQLCLRLGLKLKKTI